MPGPTPWSVSRRSRWTGSSSSRRSSRARRDEEGVTDRGRLVAERSVLTFDVPAGASSLRLRRLYDQAEVQEAEVFVDGASVGVWYDPASDPHKRWAESDFLLPPSVTRGKTRLEFEIRVARPGWNEYRYELWGFPLTRYRREGVSRRRGALAPPRGD